MRMSFNDLEYDIARSRRKIKTKVAVFFVCTAMLVASSWKYKFAENTYEVLVTDKIVKTSGVYEERVDRYLVTGIDGFGHVMSFEVTDDPVHFKFNSTDIYGGIRIGERYRFKTYGIRVPMLSWYPNIHEYTLMDE